MRGLSFILMMVLPALAWAVAELPSGTPCDTSVFLVRHTPPPTCTPYAPLDVTASVDYAVPESLAVTLFFRELGDSAGYYMRGMQPFGRNFYTTSIPARVVSRLGAEYYVEARDGMALTRAGSPQQPFVVPTAYEYRGEIPDDLPGDDYLRDIEPPPDVDWPGAQLASREDEGHSTLGLQLVLIAMFGVVGYLIYQRLDRG